MEYDPTALHISKSASARVTRSGEDGWHLEIPAHSRRGYHLAQIDDHGTHQRSSFPWRPRFTISLQARASAEDLPGTWGFGLWNDPFSLLLSYRQVAFRLPALPEAAWFFYASPQSYLSLRDDLPANGLLAATFNSSRISSVLLAVLAPSLVFSLIPGAAQGARRFWRRLVRQDAAQVHTRLAEWHTYRMEWEADQVQFYLDELEIFQTELAPRPPLSLVIWVDNQYAALPPKGRLKYGYLPNPQPAWIEIKDLRLNERN
jgi:hypothetical protein